MKWWYLSFAGEDRWNGGCVVEADSFPQAVRASHERECNPGGDVMARELVKAPGELFRNRRLNMDDLRAWDASEGGEGVAVNCETGEDA